MILLIIISLLIKHVTDVKLLLLRVLYNDIVTTIGRGNSAILVLLDLATVCILEKIRSEFVVIQIN